MTFLWSLILEKLSFKILPILKCLSVLDNSILVQDKDKLVILLLLI